MSSESNILIDRERIRAIESALRQANVPDPATGVLSSLEGRGLFSLSGLKQEVQGFEMWVDNFPAESRALESVAIVSELMNGVYQWLETGDLPAGLLDQCEKATRHRLKDVRLVGAHKLQVFSRRYQDAQERLKRLTLDPAWQVRFSLACAVAYDTPPAGPTPQQLELLECLLSDRSAKVRVMAVDKCRACRAVSLLPTLEVMRDAETNHEVQQGLEFVIPLMKNESNRKITTS